jgi:acyl-coenzyme A thioesterase PaaI-like protein
MKPAFLQTDRTENFKMWRFKTFMNWYPMYFGSGGKILFWSADSQEVHVRLKLNMWTYNYVGTIFGGSLFSASDPFYMLMWYHILGKNYVVWDKSASIRFKRPARKTLYAKYLISDTHIAEIKKKVFENNEIDIPFTLKWQDTEGVVYAEIERIVYIADKSFYENKRGNNQKPIFK